MENVSRALLIAGAILIAIILISVLLTMYNKVSNIANSKEEIVAQEQLEEYNAQFERYCKGLLYGADVITLNNKINQNNADNPSNQIKLYFDNYVVEDILHKDNEVTIITPNGSTEVTNSNVFICTKTDYNNNGKIGKIYIVLYQND